MKEFIYCTLGAVGAVIASFFGGWGTVMSTLGVLMALDYLTGMIVAGVFHASPKTDEGGLESRAGWKGLCRKGMTLIIIIVASRVDVLLGTTFFRDGTAIAFIINEALSIIENAGLMGVPIPAQLKKAIEVLKAKNDADIENE